VADLSFRWLGVAGLEITAGEVVLSIDPYLSRLPFRWMFWRLRANPAVVAAAIPRASYLLVTHAHFDHLLDVPEVVHLTGAPLYGSPNTCRLAEALGVPDSHTHLIDYGDRLHLAPYDIYVHAARHIPVPLFGPGRLPRRLRPPFSVFNYRMDTNFCLDIRVAGLRLITDPGLTPEVMGPVDVLFMYPFRNENLLRQLLPALSPRLVVPVHWDNFWRPLSLPLRSTLLPSLKRLNLTRQLDLVKVIVPGSQILKPEPAVTYDLQALLRTPNPGDS
jgi:L-ascorbate metabolism protein UlaG (beta-lactamase superfamily)